MHELGIAQQIVEITAGAIPEDLAGIRVSRIHLRIGRLTAIVPDSLRFCFEIITRDTPLADAQLVIEDVPVRCRCRTCGEEWSVTLPDFNCPACKPGRVEVVAGRELDVVSVEIPDPAPG